MPQFKIAGVDKESQLDTELVVEADTEANAKVKAELRGVVVTDIAAVVHQPKGFMAKSIVSNKWILRVFMVAVAVLLSAIGLFTEMLLLPVSAALFMVCWVAGAVVERKSKKG